MPDEDARDTDQKSTSMPVPDSDQHTEVRNAAGEPLIASESDRLQQPQSVSADEARSTPGLTEGNRMSNPHPSPASGSQGSQSTAAVRLGELIGWDRVDRLTEERKASRRRIAGRRQRLNNGGAAALFSARRTTRD